MRILDASDPERCSDAVEEAATVLLGGGLVAFPTETVYGLGANALDARAIARLYEAKGRPAWNPLIVHVASIDAALELAREWTPLAQTLAARFWPGPLTLVIESNGRVDESVSSGLSSIAVRVPAQPIAQALLRAVGVPLAAPSANRSTELSPTRAAHVAASLGDAVDLILDGGPSAVGIESTVVDVTGARAVILRPGSITRDMIESLVPTAPADESSDLRRRSPGQMERHYAPRARVVMFDRDEAPESLIGATHRVAAVTHSIRETTGAQTTVFLGDDSAAYAALIYDTLHRLDDENYDIILIERPPAGPAWEAVRDRLTRASTGEQS